METITCIKTRRSIRRYTDQPVDHEQILRIVEAASYAPSWKNTQVVRYTILENQEQIKRLAEEATMGFTPNQRTIGAAQTIAVQSVVTGLCGYEPDGTFTTAKGMGWEMYDAGISAQTFCLAAHEYGIGTVIMGIFDEEKVKCIAKIPEGEIPTAIIGMGYPNEVRNIPKRKALEEIVRFE